ncbi:MAG: family 43 glycosylhydrolase [Dysgonamonadaceae bacterium]|nr:family 43 glycosylhydrolase [Dysgonamonadaceae bacterium]
MNKFFLKTATGTMLLLLFIASCTRSNKQETLQSTSLQTVCNPVNLSYMYQWTTDPSYREGADPTIILFHDEYYAFVSHSGGYFHSTDMIHWDLIVPNDIFPVLVFAPSTVVINDTIYLVASQVPEVVKTGDPKSGKWEVANPDFKIRISDPALLLDDDGRLYYYAGCSNQTPIWGYELDPKTFEPVGEQVALISSHKKQFGWEEKTDYNTPNDETDPHIEGAWANKYKGKYYLQYASPGTELKSYNDGVYVSDKPLGPFTLAQHNPFSYKPEGFFGGAGHGSTFQDKYGNYWHIGTVSVSVHHPFERRLSLFPLFFDKDDEMYAYTGFGDYPFIIPNKKINSPEELFPEWMLLSYKKKIEVSSTLPDYQVAYDWYDGEPLLLTQNSDAKNINDENIRTWWSASSAGNNEWFILDLEQLSDVYALQINFADENVKLIARQDSIRYRYTVEYSTDKKKWEMLIDKSQNTQDAPHDYIQLKEPVKTQYLRVKNVYTPSGNFAVSDFRVFGKNDKKAPAAVNAFTAERDTDKRTVNLSWEPVSDAVGYNIRYGSRSEKLYLNYMVYDKSELSIHSLNTEQDYFFTIDAFNEGGIRQGGKIIKIGH